MSIHHRANASRLAMLYAEYHRRFVRWAFARFYREFAWIYDDVAWLVSRGLWRRWTLAALPYLDGRVLELGCGTGFVQQALAARYADQVVGIDASPQMLALTQRRLWRTRLQGQLLRAIAQALPFRAGQFDTVLATFPSEYILDPATLREVQRVLTPTGRLVMVDGAQFTSDDWYARVVDLAYRLTLQRPVRNLPDDMEAIYCSWLKKAGFPTTRSYCETVGPSRVLVLVGQKSSTGDSAVVANRM